MPDHYEPIADPAIDMTAALTVEDMARLLRLSPKLIRSLVDAKQFPIAPMRPINRHPRWWGPSVRAWCEQRAYGVPADEPTSTEPTESNP